MRDYGWYGLGSFIVFLIVLFIVLRIFGLL